MDRLQQCGVKTLLGKTKGVVFDRDITVISYYKHCPCALGLPLTSIPTKFFYWGKKKNEKLWKNEILKLSQRWREVVEQNRTENPSTNIDKLVLKFRIFKKNRCSVASARKHLQPICYRCHCKCTPPLSFHQQLRRWDDLGERFVRQAGVFVCQGLGSVGYRIRFEASTNAVCLSSVENYLLPDIIDAIDTCRQRFPISRHHPECTSVLLHFLSCG